MNNKNFLIKVFFFFVLLQGLVQNCVGQQIEDPFFAQAIRFQCAECIDAGNNLTQKARELRNLTISVNNISSIKGINGFSSLQSLSCGNNKLTEIPADLPTSLQAFNCEYNQLTTLPSLPSGLRRLDCSDNKLTVLSKLPSGLQSLDCSYNQIISLPNPLPASLNSLFANHNLLTELPPLPATLDGLIVGHNRLKSLPPLPTRMIRVSVQYNNDMKCLPLLPDNLVYLDVSDNIKCLPNIVKNLDIQRIEGVTPTAISLPFCNDLRTPPCDTFPRPIKKDSLSRLGKVPEINIFPNPTEGVAEFRCTDCTIKNIVVHNIVGVFLGIFNTVSIDFSAWSSGFYVLRIETVEGQVFLREIVKI